MGAFYVNYTIKGADQKSVVSALAGRKAFVLPERNGAIVAFDEESDQQDQEAIAKLAGRLSSTLHSTILAVLLHDSDILWYQLYEQGRLSDQYDSAPDYWSGKPEPSAPKGGDARRLCAAFGHGDAAAIEKILRATWQDYPDAMDRHADLVRALNLPDSAVGFGFESILRGDLPQGLAAKDILAS